MRSVAPIFDTSKLSAEFSLLVILRYDMESDCGVIFDVHRGPRPLTGNRPLKCDNLLIVLAWSIHSGRFGTICGSGRRSRDGTCSEASDVGELRAGAVIAACFALLNCVAAGFAAADCVGYATESERIEFADNHAALIATATATALERHDRTETGGAPIDVYTFTIDAIHHGEVSSPTVRTAAPQGSSIARTFRIGER